MDSRGFKEIKLEIKAVWNKVRVPIYSSGLCADKAHGQTHPDNILK